MYFEVNSFLKIYKYVFIQQMHQHQILWYIRLIGWFVCVLGCVGVWFLLRCHKTFFTCYNSGKALACFIILLVYLLLPHPLINWQQTANLLTGWLMTLSPLFNSLQCQGYSFSLLSADTRGHTAGTRGGWCFSCCPLRDVVVSLSSCSVLFVTAWAQQHFRNFPLPTCGSIGHERNRRFATACAEMWPHSASLAASAEVKLL